MEEDKSEMTSKYFQSTEGDSPTPTMLSPDHPLMKRYQLSLKNHLLKQREKLNEELQELKTELKKTKIEEENIEVTICNAKQDIDLHQKLINERQAAFDDLIAKRNDLETHLNEKKKSVKYEKNKVNDFLRKELELKTKLEKMLALERQLQIWKDATDKDLAVKQRISEKTEIEKKELAEEKKKIDLYILRLMSEISKWESERDMLDEQIKIRSEERNVMNQTLADANTDLQSLIDDYKRLMIDWKSVVNTMSHRDAVYAEILKEHNISQESFRQLNIEIESYKKSSIEEMDRSGELGLMIMRAKQEKDNYNRQIKYLEEKKNELFSELCQLNAIASHTERDLQIAQTNCVRKEAELMSLQKRVENLNSDKRLLEDDTLHILLDQATNDKAAININRQVKHLRTQIQEKEMEMAELENKIAKLCVEINEIRENSLKRLEVVKDLHQNLNEKESEIKKIETEIRGIHIQMSTRQNTLVATSKRVMEIEEFQKLNETSQTLKQQIDDITFKIKEMHKKNLDLQSDWLVQQTKNVKLNQQKSDQLREIGISRKQILVLEQKKVRLENEIEKEKKITYNIEKHIEHLQQKMVNLNVTLAETVDQREQLDKNLLFAQTQLIQNLKDAEMEQLNLANEVKDSEASLAELEEQLLETQREMLSWEKKIKMVSETKNMIKKEWSEDGDICQMKQEIHRMEVRMSNLKKVQDKLMTDLEQTVTRRENIITAADLKVKKCGGGQKTASSRKIEGLRKKLKQIQKEKQSVCQLITEATATNEDMRNELKEKTEHLEKWQKETKKMEEQLEEGHLRKQHNLELLVRRQRKCKFYEELKAGTYRVLHRNDLQLDNELLKAKTKNSNLTEICEALVNDFPNHRILFKKISNSLKPDVL